MTSFRRIVDSENSFEETDDNEEDVFTLADSDEIITIDKTKFRKTRTDTLEWWFHSIVDIHGANIRSIQVRSPAGETTFYHEIERKHVGHMVDECPECLPCSNRCGVCSDGKIHLDEGVYGGLFNKYLWKLSELEAKAKQLQKDSIEKDPNLCIWCDKELGKISRTYWINDPKSEELIGHIHQTCHPLMVIMKELYE